METRSHGVLINAAGFLYASLGFSLSVLAALLSIFHRRKVQDVATIPFHTRRASPSRGRRPLRALSDQPEKAVTPPLPSPAVEVHKPSPEKVRLSLHRSVSAHELRRSKSMVPTITVDYFGSPDSPHRITSAEVVVIDSPIVTNPVNPLPEIRPFVISPPPSPPPTVSSTSSETSSKHDRSGFRIFHIKHWGKDKSKTIARRQSSPHLCPVSAFCPSKMQPPSHKQTISDGMIPTISAKDDVKSKSRSILRKMPSVPAHEKHINSTPRKAEKKRSQTLRTHPYEAPYFAPPPVPPLPAYRPQTREETISASPSRSIDRKHSKPQIAKP